MKVFIKLALASAFVFGSLTSVSAAEYTQGVIKKVNMKLGKVTIKHGELKNLDMPGMTMVFRTANKDMLEKMKAGTKIQFIADRVKGKLTVVEVK